MCVESHINKMQIVTIKIRGFQNRIQGILIFEDAEWYILIHNEVDYVLNGIVYINKKHVLHVETISPNNLLYKILFIKFNNNTQLLNYIPNNDINTLNTKGDLIGITCGRETSMYVGKIVKMHKKSFSFKTYSTSAIPLEMIDIRIETIRCISVFWDYLNSLQLYINYNR